MYSKISNVKVVGMATAVSTRWDSIREISDEDEKVLRKFTKKIGVEGRWSASLKQTTSDFCYAAASRLLEEKGIDRKKIGVLVFVTQTADYRIPSTACVLQDRLGLCMDTLAFDVNLGCSGFVYGLEIASSLLSVTETDYALLLAGDTSARERSPEEKQKTSRSASLLFGDSGTATLIKKENGTDLLFSSATDGARFGAIVNPYGAWRNPVKPESALAGTQMNDMDVFSFATNEVPEQIDAYMRRMHTAPDDYDDLVLHQANLMILKQIAKKTGFPTEKMPISIDRFGNTSSSSIPLTIVDRYGKQKESKIVNELCCGFGVGLSWATVALRLDTVDVLPLIHTDAFYKDGFNLDDQIVDREN